jgi:hypothetical protein
MIEFNHLNLADSVPQVGDTLIIRTKKSGSKNISCQVKEVIKSGVDIEIVLQKSTNSFFNWGMYTIGNSWVWRVWNLGKVELTTSSNSMKNFVDM